MMQKNCTWSGGTIAYTIYGEGIPVVLLHGFGEDSSIWNRQVGFLQQHCKLIVPDLPGTGNSQWGIVNGEWSIVNRAEDSLTIDHSPFTTPSIDHLAYAIYELLLQENILSCYLFGHSMGGYITLALAEKYPSLLKGFGLIHSTAFADSEEKKKNRVRGIELMEQYGGYSFLKTTIPNLFGQKFKETDSPSINQLMEQSKAFSTLSLQAYYYAMMKRPDRTHILKGNPLPVLFVMGTEDVAAPLNDVLQQSHLPLISYIHILDGIGHMGMWESTDRMNQLLLSFIQQ
ncbi:alpha/beta fold hydrolase [Sediminibacterium goheungense]|uniref:Pimeloyl-ACP methyl ester carboxylesterase n=1 Tax=Sediminibacterium goheungense TaxID=1086393 RepID=A0A4R6J1K5_9BACT|nr:alpha/beta hydrolase [Sediminibacterium goheungense]TDO28631.1 pimeloyl-ACP methyl ester carboxylesterase [Sediminibacterium goheungense]